MRSRFGRFGPGRVRLIRERLLYVSSGALTAALAAVIGVVAYSYEDAHSGEAYAARAPRDSLTLDTVLLLSPMEEVKQGTRLSQVNFRELYWPRERVPEGAIRAGEDVRSLYAKVDLPTGQPMLQSNLSLDPLIGGVADLIPPGHRATTIEVDETSGVEGWATPGAHVDVLITYHDQVDGLKKSQIVVEDAVVVSYNGKTSKTTHENNRSSQTTTVTLAVPVIDAVRIHTGRALGEISLILRNTSDLKSVGSPVVTSRDFQLNNIEPKRTVETPSGFVRFIDSNGIERQLELRADQRWWSLDQGGM